MPRQEHNISRQRSTSYAITINGLLTNRARLMREGRKDRDRRDQIATDIAAIDHVLTRVLGFTGDIEAVTRDFKREAVFKRGEMFAVICDVLRQADRPLTTREIAKAVYATKGKTVGSGRQSKEWINRVRHACKRLERDGTAMVAMDGHGDVVWLVI